VYYSRLGAKEFVAGKKDAANTAWDTAESLAQNSYSSYELASIYRHFNIRIDRIQPLLNKALQLYDRYYDPASERYLPVTREEILHFLEQIPRMSPSK
jgi:hypothetical protein